MSGQYKENVLYLHRTQGGGAEEVHILGIARALEEAGVRVDILSPHGLVRPAAVQAPSAEKAAPKPGKLLPLISRHAPELVFELLEIAYNLLACWRLLRIGVSSYQWVFERYAVFGIVGSLLAKFARLPLIVEVNYTSKSPLVRRRSKLLMPLARRMDRWIFNSATLLVPVSSALKKELMHDFGIPEEKILMLPNAADPVQFAPTALRHKSVARKIIGFVGGFYPWHGLDLLIEAYAGIADRFPESQVLLVGDGPELERIRALVSRHGLMERVIFGGRKKHHELPAAMSAFYVGVMPDSNDYGSPMKIFEYMALGVPVIAPDYSPILDAMDDGEQGLIFEQRSVEGLRAALVKLLQDESLAQHLGTQGRETILRDRNWNANAARIRDALLQRCNEALPAMRKEESSHA
ncbi:glycosyltransferase family 4 protein [Noviherbaspirillum massiliense]|uniref:glycosyltransferase family 4 protein n=1 Tax=Noviherbaspirillum massiliense TaxID=1465823 RepID=UPI0002F7ED62|nr:glycosyltransferase family 4 protein [Noviherbaspirillum massiliense]